jgi:hypothetical protein
MYNIFIESPVITVYIKEKPRQPPPPASGKPAFGDPSFSRRGFFKNVFLI